jgi:hypothetical protein
MSSWGWGQRIAQLLPYHWDRIRQIEHDLGVSTRAYTNSQLEVVRLEHELKESAEARLRAEDHARFLQTQLTHTQSQLESITTKLFLTHEKTTDFLALATSGGRRGIFTSPDPAAASPTVIDEHNQPLTVGRMRGADARTMMTKVATAEDQRRQEESRRYAEMLRQRLAAERDQTREQNLDTEPSEPVVSIRRQSLSAEQQKASADIADAIEKELMGEVG